MSPAVREETGGSLGLDGFWPREENSASKEEAESGRMTPSPLLAATQAHTQTETHKNT